MHASDGRKWFEGTLSDPEARRYCFIFDAIAAIATAVAPELFGFGAAEAGALGAGEAAGAGLLGAEAAGAGAGAGAAEAAGGGGFLGGLFDAGGFFGSQGPLFGTAADASIAGGGAPLSLGGEAAGAALGGAEAAGGGGSLVDFLGFGGGLPGGEAATGAGGGMLGPISVEPLSGSAVPAATVSPAAPGAGAIAPAVPAGIPASPAATGAFDPFLGMDVVPGQNLGAASATGGGIASGAGGGTSGGLTGGLDKLVSSATGGLLNTKDLGLLTSVGGLGMNLLNRNRPIPGEKQFNAAAGSLNATAQAQGNKGMQLESYLNTGTLPPGLEAGMKSAEAAAEASIRASHAKAGTAGSSAEAQDIQAAHDRAQTAAAQVALQLLQQGSSMVGQSVNTEAMAAQLYQAIMANALSQDEALGKAIGNFAGALSGSGGSGGSTITLRAA